MQEVANVGLRVLGRSAWTARKALSAVPVLLIAAGALVVSAPHAAFAAPDIDGIDAGANHTCSVVSAAVYCWGRNFDGRVGDGSSTRRTTAVPVDADGVLAGLRMTRISSGGTHTCALSSAGRAYCWGAGGSGQLGDGGAVRRTSPVPVDTGGVLSGVALTRISAGSFHTCALSATGRAYCWGNGSGGRLGDGAHVSWTRPVPVLTGGVGLVDISAGGSHTCAVSSAGGVYCWGAGGSGPFGNGRAARASVPAPVDTSGALSGVTITRVAAGAGHTCALSSAGAVYCWGRNTSGQLGDGSTESSSVPVPVDTSGALSGVTVTQIAAGAGHTCALSSAGAAYCWGANAGGQIGDGGGINRSTPVAVDAGAAKSGVPLHRITAGNNHTCAASATVVRCWGLNSFGQLGDGAGTDRTGPVPVDVRTPPDPPTAVTATAGDGRARVSWRARPDGTVRAYRVTASPGGATCTSSTTSCAVTGLANGTAYTFTVVARNAYGRSAPSAESGTATPFAPSPVKEKAGGGELTPFAPPARPKRIAPTAEATGHPDPVTPFAAGEHHAAPLRAGPDTAALPAAPSALPDVPSRVTPGDTALASTTAVERPSAGPAQVAAVVLGMGLLVFAGTAVVAYRGRRRIDQVE